MRPGDSTNGGASIRGTDHACHQSHLFHHRLWTRSVVRSCRGATTEGVGALKINFYGVRGSTPCSCDSNQRYGGNTACVVVEGDGFDPIVFDLGTGLRFWGLAAARPDFHATALVSHLHWDHVQGLPFFSPIHVPDGRLDIYAPRQDDRSLREAFDSFMAPPYFPVRLDDLAGTVTFTEVVDGDDFDIGAARVTSAPIPHLGPTVGYRVVVDDVSVAYVSDHQQPGCGATTVSDRVLELCAGADVLIHDAQYTDVEFMHKSDWGHCTVDYAIEVAAQAGVKRLVLFHHDPSHTDDTIDALLRHATKVATARGITEVIAASEGLSLDLS